jgi:uncharacterized protein (TIGR00251 family)
LHASNVLIELRVHVIPRSSKPGIVGVRDRALLVRLQSSPVQGAANDELVRLIAKVFAVAKRDVTIVAGEHSKLKRVAIATIDRNQLAAVLNTLGIDPNAISS